MHLFSSDKTVPSVIHAALIAMPLLLFMGHGAAQATDLAYGPDTCKTGYVWRGAIPSDHVCVTSRVRDLTATENARADRHRQPGGGAYGPNTCKTGYVWREAYQGDVVCVTSAVRDRTHADNARAASRRAQ